MPLDFVRYTSEIETLDSDFDRLLGQIIVFWERRQRHGRPTMSRTMAPTGGAPNDQIIGVRRGAYLVSVAERTGGWQRRIDAEADLVHAELTGRA